MLGNGAFDTLTADKQPGCENGNAPKDKFPRCAAGNEFFSSCLIEKPLRSSVVGNFAGNGGVAQRSGAKKDPLLLPLRQRLA